MKTSMIQMIVKSMSQKINKPRKWTILKVNQFLKIQLIQFKTLYKLKPGKVKTQENIKYR